MFWRDSNAGDIGRDAWNGVFGGWKAARYGGG